ncbi:hypothetical protein SERLADRAFT_470433 [Serpula lacrymans var. lacrymans S7.9]|uniref:Uncharacterized protein n=1 Tax=Serpula lacrymans var. lacrymans (strain S7.9) TaxID=578457 RepID=F8NZB1_SERL9|nr:uncharacterized protein SERLADRAFT_470433 [Serpula lacrymans var. lacrymans S7.9]EGO23931.1 hypothetical protein SERLADRAFT_470433 [Serpula lacrymans var. lacrymans S7.9]
MHTHRKNISSPPHSAPATTATIEQDSSCYLRRGGPTQSKSRPSERRRELVFMMDNENLADKFLRS